MTRWPQPVRGRRAFRALSRQGRQARSGPVTVHFSSASAAGDEVRVSYAISRKVGGAVVRNHWRRRLRAIVAEGAVDASPGAYLIALSPSVRSLHFDELRERVIETMRKASVDST